MSALPPDSPTNSGCPCCTLRATTMRRGLARPAVPSDLALTVEELHTVQEPMSFWLLSCCLSLKFVPRLLPSISCPVFLARLEPCLMQRTASQPL